MSAETHRYRLTIASGNDVSDGDYESRIDAMDAADDAASVDGLTARYGSPNSGTFVDADGMPWFEFTITTIVN